MMDTTIRVSQEVHEQLTAYALDLAVVLQRRISINEALKVLLPPVEVVTDDH